MQLQAISNILFLFFIFVYMYYGDYHNNQWSAAFYSVLSLYLIMSNLTFIKKTEIKIHRQVFRWTGLFFLVFFATEGLCFIFPGKYYDLVVNINLWIAGSLFMILFFILTYKALKQ